MRRTANWHWLLLALVLVATLPSSRAEGDTEDTAELQRQIELRDRQIEGLSERLEELETRVEQIEEPSGGDEAPEVPTASEEPSHPEAAGEDLAPADARENERLIASAFEQTLIERGGLLLPWRSYSIQAGLTYVHSSAENIIIDGFTIFPVLVVGDIVSEKVDRNLELLTLTGRVGLPWDSQLELRVPYGFLRYRSASADGEEIDRTDAGIGDVELALSHQLYRSDGTWPDLLASFAWKFDTGQNPFKAEDSEIFVGTGYQSANLSLTGVKVVDPVVYFAGGSYTYNLSTHERVGKFEPSYSAGFNVGMAIALNLNTSLSLAYDQQFTGKSKLDGDEIPGSYSTVGVVSFGSTFSFRDYLSLDFTVGVGVTSDSPDVLVTINLPFRGRF